MDSTEQTDQELKNDPRWQLVWSDPQRLGGELLFEGTRVYVDMLWGYLAGGGTVDDFAATYPSVNREQAAQVIELAGRIFEREALSHECVVR